jgi:hypothetical protein
MTETDHPYAKNKGSIFTTRTADHMSAGVSVYFRLPVAASHCYRRDTPLDGPGETFAVLNPLPHRQKRVFG